MDSFQKLLSLPHIFQAMWALGNIAGDGASMRDYVLEKNIIKPLVALAAQGFEVRSECYMIRLHVHLAGG